jgi:hypothetical protein
MLLLAAAPQPMTDGHHGRMGALMLPVKRQRATRDFSSAALCSCRSWYRDCLTHFRICTNFRNGCAATALLIKQITPIRELKLLDYLER